MCHGLSGPPRSTRSIGVKTGLTETHDQHEFVQRKILQDFLDVFRRIYGLPAFRFFARDLEHPPNFGAGTVAMCDNVSDANSSLRQPKHLRQMLLKDKTEVL